MFLDLGFPPVEAANLLLRSTLMIKLRDIMTKRKLTPTKAAKIFGVDPSCIQDLKKRNLEKMDLNLLFDMLSRAGMQVKIEVTSAKRKKVA